MKVSHFRVFTLTLLAMIAFAANAVLCRLALKATEIDAASFTTIRLASGALALWLIIHFRNETARGMWFGALALFAYAAPFSFAFITLETGLGALLLFGIAWECIRCWGAVSLIRSQIRGQLHARRASRHRLSLAALPWAGFNAAGAGYAILSGALASGVGYAIRYAALRDLSATRAAVVQLSVPVIAALGGVVFVSEPITLRPVIASAAILGGIALVLVKR